MAIKQKYFDSEIISIPAFPKPHSISWKYFLGKRLKGNEKIFK
jgi:hypothetical protein